MTLKYTPRCCVTLQFTAERALEIDALAQALAVPRHRLLVSAVDLGLPLAEKHFRAVRDLTVQSDLFPSEVTHG